MGARKHVWARWSCFSPVKFFSTWPMMACKAVTDESASCWWMSLIPFLSECSYKDYRCKRSARFARLFCQTFSFCRDLTGKSISPPVHTLFSALIALNKQLCVSLQITVWSWMPPNAKRSSHAFPRVPKYNRKLFMGSSKWNASVRMCPFRWGGKKKNNYTLVHSQWIRICWIPIISELCMSNASTCCNL